MLHQLYSGLGAGLYPLLLFLCPLIEAIGGRVGYGFSQRLGRYTLPLPAQAVDGPTLWVHAASVGEVRAALVLVAALRTTHMNLHVVVTSTTEQGHRLAASRMPAGVECLLAPLDLPQAVTNALQTLRPHCYICLETELWPVMLSRLRREGVSMLLLNGRMSSRSFARYRRIRSTMASLLAGFDEIAVIDAADGQRYATLGVPASRIQVCGNLKYDLAADSVEVVRLASRKRLLVDTERVFLCGSTHEGEEEQLLPVFLAIAAKGPAVWVIAPRHLERLPAVETFLTNSGIPFDRFSNLAGQGRCSQVVLLDTMGDLSDLYAGGDHLFCGGSLVKRGGHNIIEAARWGRPVYFGPHMKDFQDAAEMLVREGGGFQVADATELTSLLLAHIEIPERYDTACVHAADAAARQRGAVARQAAIVRRVLADCCAG